MDRRDAVHRGAVEPERKKLTKEELDAMPMADVLTLYEDLAKEIRNRTKIIHRFMAKTEARTEEQRGNVNDCRDQMLAEKMAEAVALQAYIGVRMLMPI